MKTFEDASLSPVEKIDKYLARQRNGLIGCKLGRLSNEKAFTDAELRAPLQQFFELLLATVHKQIELAVKDGTMPADTPAKDISHVIVAAIQGGYVLSKSTDKDDAVNCSTQGARALLKAYSQ